MRLIMPKLISISLPKLFIHGHFIVVHGPKHQKTHQLTAVCTQLRSRQQAVRSFRPQNPRILQERLASEIIGLKHASRTRDDVTALMVCRSKPLPLSRKEVEHLPKNKTWYEWDSNSWYEWDSTASASRCSAARSVGADPPRKRLRTSRTPISRHVAHLCLHVCVTGCVLRTHAHKHTHTHTYAYTNMRDVPQDFQRRIGPGSNQKGWRLSHSTSCVHRNFVFSRLPVTDPMWKIGVSLSQ